MREKENNFKASIATAKQGVKFDENGVFTAGCARHGVPYLMHDISGGEG